MLVTFTTDAYVDITLVGDVTLVMLKMRRHRAIVPGTIQAEDAPAALSRKTDAIDAENPSTLLLGMDGKNPTSIGSNNKGWFRVGYLTDKKCWRGWNHGHHIDSVGIFPGQMRLVYNHRDRLLRLKCRRLLRPNSCQRPSSNKCLPLPEAVVQPLRPWTNLPGGSGSRKQRHQTELL